METVVPSSSLPWLPGPILTVEHRAAAVQNTVNDLRRRAGRRRHHRPQTWIHVAEGLGILCVPYNAPDQSAGRLAYDPVEDRWVIMWNVARSPIHQAATLVHELAHYYFREARGEWLCGEAVVYFYEGPVEDEQHKLAYDVERVLVQRWEKVPAIGLFEED